MKKLVLILVLGYALAACAGETTAIVVAATPVPPTATPAPPTATPIPPTITPEPWDARVSALAGNLREFPHLNSQIMHTLIGGAKVDLLAISPDNKWVHAKTAAVEGNPILEGWLQVDKLVLNVSLDDLKVDAETVFIQPPTRTPGPTSVPLNERFIDHFVEQGFENLVNPTEFIKRAGRGFLFVAIQHDEDGSNPRFGFISRINATQEERDLTLAHLDEAAAFIDPVDGLDIAYSGMETITTNRLTIGSDGTWRRMWADGETWAQFIHTSTGQEVFIQYVYEEENIIKVFFTYLPVGWQHPTE